MFQESSEGTTSSTSVASSDDDNKEQVDDNNEQFNDNNEQVKDNSEQIEAEGAADRPQVRSLARLVGIGPPVVVVPEVTYIDVFERGDLNTILT